MPNPLPPLTLANAFTLIVEASNVAQPTSRWRNVYDIHATVQPLPGDAIINAIANWARANLRDDAELAKLTLRHWTQGVQPFAQRPFLWEDFLTGSTGNKPVASPNGYGGQQSGTQVVPGSAVAFCKRVTAGQNKASNLFLRGLLDDGDISSVTGGKYVLVGSSRVTAVTFDAVVNQFLTPYLGAGKDPGLIIVHVGNHHLGPAFSSPVTDIQFVGPSQNKQTRKNPR